MSGLKWDAPEPPEQPGPEDEAELSPEERARLEQARIEGYLEGFDDGWQKGLRRGAASRDVPPKGFGPIRGPTTRDLFPVMAAEEPDRLVTLFALCRVEHQQNRRNGAPLGEIAP